MDKQECDITASERRFFTNHILANANAEALKKHALRMSCFERSGGLMRCKKSDTDNLVKPQGIVSGIKTPETCVLADYETIKSIVAEHSTPTQQVAQKNDK